MTAFIASLLYISVAALKVVLFAAIVVGSVVAANKYLSGEEAISLDFLKKLKKENVTCPDCHTVLKKNFKFCPHCGSTIVIITETKPQEQLELPV